MGLGLLRSGERIREGLDGMVLHYKQSPRENPDVKLSQSWLLRVTRVSEWMGARIENKNQRVGLFVSCGSQDIPVWKLSSC